MPVIMSIFWLSLIAAEPGTWAWLIDLAGPVLVAQAIAGLIGLASLIFVIRRFLGTDFPAFRTEVNNNLSTLHADLRDLRNDLQSNKMEVARLAERHDSLRGRVDRIEAHSERLDLDDTRTRRRPRRDTE